MLGQSRFGSSDETIFTRPSNDWATPVAGVAVSEISFVPPAGNRAMVAKAAVDAGEWG
jgi:hypothetical protein